MAMERRTRITIERERILVIARQHAVRGWCEKCGCEVELVPSNKAGQFLDIGPLDRRHSSKLHLVQAKEGLVVCLKSLLRFLQAASGQSQ